MDPFLEHKLLATRRHLLGSMAGGIGAIAMHELLAATSAAPVPALPADPMAAKLPPLPAKAKRMIVIHLTGSPPNLDMYDNKPELTKRDGQECPAEAIAG
ncbi:MAG: sulfatase, partial [Planctomycetia bacterium]|nr:sulfatase [Planctomycetia bacterium]